MPSSSPPAGEVIVGNVGAAGVQGAVAGAGVARDVMTLDRDLELLSERVGLVENQKNALSAMAELSGNAGEFLGRIFDHVKKFSFEEIDWSNLWQEFTGSLPVPDVQIYIDVLEGFKRGIEGIEQRNRDEWYNSDEYRRLREE